jgi:hypothetical protein
MVAWEGHARAIVLKFYIDNQEWLDTVTSGEYQVYYDVSMLTVNRINESKDATE